MSRSAPTSALIIATYNWPRALALCLESVRLQTTLPQEVIIADDGSGSDTAAVIRDYQSVLPLRHVWQPDEGYQLARIRNKAFAAATADYLIQIDGDLLLDPHFVADHLRAARPGYFISGTRAVLSEAETDRVLALPTLQPKLNPAEIRKRYNAKRHAGLSLATRLWQRSQKGVHFVLGCNMAFWRHDLLQVNGYNEAFQGWGKEDNDLAARLVNAGVRLRFLKFGAVAYHLHHPQTARPMLSENVRLFEESLNRKITFVSKGIQQ